MAETKDTIINAIKNFISQNGGKSSDYYVGVTSDPEKRLFDEHKVSRNGVYDYWEAISADFARAAEKYYVELIGTDGGTGGGDGYSKYVYIYEKTSYTEENA
ncbi:MAG: hypothetical protein PHF50_00880 [Patescibacteria group bacterium]|nr:hypothetical protein [Patescibacteria group bacterium]